MTLRHDGRARFFVTFNTDEECYVDLLCYQGNGRCDCWQFIGPHGLKQRLLAAIEAGTFVPGEYQCPHIRFADRELLRMFKAQLLKQYPDNDQDT